MNKKLSTALIALIIFSMFIFSSCTKDNSKIDKNDDDVDVIEKEYTPSYGGRLTVPVYNVKTLNPLLNGDKTLFYFNKMIYEGLFDLDSNLNVKNVLAESYEIKNEGKTIDIKLREDVYWHTLNENEEPTNFTSEDVKFTIETLKYGANDTMYSGLLGSVYKTGDPSNIKHILRVRVIDEYNIRIEFDRSYSNGLESLIFPIISEKQFDSYKEALQSNLDFIPKGTGPYKITEYNKLKSIELVSNDNWWNDKPYIERITGKILPDRELLITSFEAGKIDLTLSREVDWEKYSDNKTIEKYEFTTQNYEFLGFNFNNELLKDQLGQAIRKSIAYSIDLNSIIENIYLGHATQVDVPLSPNSWLLSEEFNYYGYDKNKAEQILRENGFEDRDSDGIVEDLSGRKLSFRLLTNTDNELRLKTADMIISNLKEVGIEVKLQLKANSSEDYDEWQVVQQKLFSGDYDIALLGWQLSNLPDLSFAFHSSQIENGYNFINYNNQLMDNLLVDAFRAPTREKKKESYYKIQKVITDDLPYISLFYKNGSLLIDDKVRGDIDPQSFNIYYNIEKWFIPEELRDQNNDINDNDSKSL